ncbi:DinB family protein [Daejeonella sp. H1SJ63]|jgi:uncharacterized damage-inducible protein DinB|uniref:DinB family protein n=1 Tax=Daejeonella sp. H1SJ63 TaxID=3034145 RepID=UPI0023ED9496|nr:DinB family protein [Daejeonella sp. H1SJ63]
MNKYQQFISLWEEGRTRFSKLLSDLTEEDLGKKLAPAPNSVGFLIRHIGDVELLFAKNVFNYEGVKVHAKTVIAQKDTGEWTNLAELLAYDQLAYESLKAAILAHDEEAWEECVITKEFGTKTKAESLGRIITHTAYHAGQLAMILKYGRLTTEQTL